MLTFLYAATFNRFLNRKLDLWLARSVGRNFLDKDRRLEAIAINRRVYEKKLPEELQLAMQDLKVRIPWINTAFWLYMISAIACIFCFNRADSSQEYLIASMVSGGISFAMIIALLAKFTGIFYTIIEEMIRDRPATFMVIQLPLFFIQMMLAIASILGGVFTLKVMPCVSGVMLLGMAFFTQYRAMHTFIERFESQDLDCAMQNEFLKGTSALYSRSVRGRILEDAMEGSSVSIRSLQALQGDDAETSTGDCADDLLAL